MFLALVAATLGVSLTALCATLYLGLKTRNRFREARQQQRKLEHRIDRALDRLDQIRATQKRIEARLAVPEWPNVVTELRPWLKHIKLAQQQLGAAQSLSSLDLRFPIFFRDWSIDSLMGRELVELIESRRPSVILELGSGVSSVLVAATLERLGLTKARHIVVDHLQDFLDETKRRVEVQGLGRQTEYWLCPLQAGREDGPAWYSGLPERLGDTRLDLVLIDGPPGKLHPEARRPAFSVLRPLLSEKAVLVLDDANRRSERAIVRAWEKENPDFELVRYKTGKGLARFMRRGESNLVARDE